MLCSRPAYTRWTDDASPTSNGWTRYETTIRGPQVPVFITGYWHFVETMIRFYRLKSRSLRILWVGKREKRNQKQTKQSRLTIARLEVIIFIFIFSSNFNLYSTCGAVAADVSVNIVLCKTLASIRLNRCIFLVSSEQRVTRNLITLSREVSICITQVGVGYCCCISTIYYYSP